MSIGLRWETPGSSTCDDECSSLGMQRSDAAMFSCARTRTLQGSHKTCYLKRKLNKKVKQNRPIPYWFRLRTDNTIRYAD
jgi:ribosomal protein L39E